MKTNRSNPHYGVLTLSRPTLRQLQSEWQAVEPLHAAVESGWRIPAAFVLQPEGDRFQMQIHPCFNVQRLGNAARSAMSCDRSIEIQQPGEKIVVAFRKRLLRFIRDWRGPPGIIESLQNGEVPVGGRHKCVDVLLGQEVLNRASPPIDPGGFRMGSLVGIGNLAVGSDMPAKRVKPANQRSIRMNGTALRPEKAASPRLDSTKVNAVFQMLRDESRR